MPLAELPELPQCVCEKMEGTLSGLAAKMRAFPFPTVRTGWTHMSLQDAQTDNGSLHCPSSGLDLSLLVSTASSLFSHCPNWPIFAGQVDLLFYDQAKTESKLKT